MYLNELKKKEEIKANGLWKPLYIEDQEIGRVLMAVPPPKVSQSTRERLTRKYKSDRRIKMSAELTTEQEFEVFMLMLKELYLKDWDDASDGTEFPVLEEGGERLEFNSENVDVLLEISDIRVALVEMVAAINEMTTKDLDEDRKN